MPPASPTAHPTSNAGLSNLHPNLLNFKYLFSLSKPNIDMIFLWCSFSTPYVYSLREYVIVGFFFFFFFFAEDDCELNIWIIDLWICDCVCESVSQRLKIIFAVSKLYYIQRVGDVKNILFVLLFVGSGDNNRNMHKQTNRG